MPAIIARLPESYFVHRKRTPKTYRHPLLHITLVILKNALGVFFLLAGVAMLVLPGQGILTILAGLFLLDLPGKFAAERWIVRRPTVFKSLNWLRKKMKVPPFQRPPSKASASTSETQETERAAAEDTESQR